MHTSPCVQSARQLLRNATAGRVHAGQHASYPSISQPHCITQHMARFICSHPIPVRLCLCRLRDCADCAAVPTVRLCLCRCIAAVRPLPRCFPVMRARCCDLAPVHDTVGLVLGDTCVSTRHVPHHVSEHTQRVAVGCLDRRCHTGGPGAGFPMGGGAGPGFSFDIPMSFSHGGGRGPPSRGGYGGNAYAGAYYEDDSEDEEDSDEEGCHFAAYDHARPRRRPGVRRDHSDERTYFSQEDYEKNRAAEHALVCCASSWPAAALPVDTRQRNEQCAIRRGESDPMTRAEQVRARQECASVGKERASGGKERARSVPAGKRMRQVTGGLAYMHHTVTVRAQSYTSCARLERHTPSTTAVRASPCSAATGPSGTRSTPSPRCMQFEHQKREAERLHMRRQKAEVMKVIDKLPKPVKTDVSDSSISLTIDRNRKLRGAVRFSPSPLPLSQSQRRCGCHAQRRQSLCPCSHSDIRQQSPQRQSLFPFCLSGVDWRRSSEMQTNRQA